MVNEEPRVERFEGELRAATWSGERRGRATTGTGHGVQIDVMRQLRGRVIVEVKLDDIAFANTDEGTGDRATECPEGIIYPIGHA